MSGHSKVTVCKNNVKAWFPNAIHPVIWQTPLTDVPLGFELRPVDNRIELVKHEYGTPDTVIASFSNSGAAEEAFAKLSIALLRKSFFGRRLIMGFLSVVGAIFIVWIGCLWAVNALHSYSKVSATALSGPVNATPTKPPAGTPVDVDQLFH